MNIREFIGHKLARFGTNMAIAGQVEGHERTRRFEDLPRERGSQEDLLESRNDREEVMIAARAMCQLFGLGNRILRTYANYVVGECEVFWHTEDEKWNDAAAELFAAKSKLLDVRGREDFSGLARLALISQFRDGDCGFVKVKGMDGFPMLEPIEADRIGPRNLTNGLELVGGVKLNAYQRPLSYYIADRAKWGSYQNLRPIGAADFIHIFDSMRFDSVRGLSAFAYGALGRSRSLRQLIRSEQTGVEVANKWAMSIEQNGPPLDSGLNLTDNNEDQPSGNGTKAPPIQDLHDGLIFHAQPGEKLAFPQNNRPGAAWQGFIEFLIHDYAISLDLPFEFVWSMAGLGGPAVRLASKQAERTFRHQWRVLNRRFFIPTVSWVIADAMESGQLAFNPEFWDFSVQRPDHPTIDVGRESQANISEYEQGWVSGADVCGESGRNIYKQMRQKGREKQYALMIEKEFGLPPNSIIEKKQPTPAAPASQAGQMPRADETEDEPMPPIPAPKGAPKDE